jgi:Tol biopolymer transport system component/serine/threonine protein kinase
VQPERWGLVKELLAACLELDPSERSDYLDRTCGHDAGLRAELESLIASYDDSGDPLDEGEARTADEADATQIIGRRIGPYRIIEEIGEGGMSRVYLGVRADDAFRKRVAVKVVKRGMDYEFVLRRFRNERQIMAGLEHPNIARLLDGGATADGTPFFVMEYIQGSPIDRHADERDLSVRERLDLFLTVCAAVAYAHERRIIHRDIKPENILITEDGAPKLLDFGIAKVIDPENWTQTFAPTGSLVRLMTPEYASPEQVRGAAVNETTDIYSLGVLLYELLAGHRPYQLVSRAPHEVAQAICEVEPPRPSTMAGRAEEVSEPDKPALTITPEDVAAHRRTQPAKLRRALAGDLDNIVLKAMRKESARRYASVADLAADIRRHLEGRPVAARKDTWAYRAGKLIKRNRAAVLAGTVAVVATAGLALLLLRTGSAPSNGAAAAPAVTPFTTLSGQESQPAFSPDGSRIAFIWNDEGNSVLYVKQRSNGQAARVHTGGGTELSPAWSPDGSRLAFLRATATETGVFIASLRAGELTKIADLYPTRLEAVGRHLDWSPDGKLLALVDKEGPEGMFGIYLMDAAGGPKRRITSPPAKAIGDFSPAFSPDSRSISFLRAPASGITELYVVPLAGGEPRRLTWDNREILSQAWAADGKSIYFSSSRLGSTNLWRIGLEGGVPKRVPGIAEGASDPALSRDGRYLVYSQSFTDTNVWQLDVGANPPYARRLISSTQYDSSAQFSPDGLRIAFRSNRSGNNEIWVATSEGGNQTQLTHFGGPLTGTPRWSPDGRRIAFDSRPDGQADIYIVAADGGEPRRLTFENAEDVVPSWSHDGKWVYFGSRRTGTWQVWKAPAERGDAVQVTRLGGFAAFESADGKYVYYAKGRADAGLYRVPVEGGEETLVLAALKPGFWGYWAPSADGIYFADTPVGGASMSIHFFRFGDRRTAQIATSDKPPMIGDSAMALSPDGRTLLYTQVDQSGSDIMLADMGPPQK